MVKTYSVRQMTDGIRRVVIQSVVVNGMKLNRLRVVC